VRRRPSRLGPSGLAKEDESKAASERVQNFAKLEDRIDSLTEEHVGPQSPPRSPRVSERKQSEERWVISVRGPQRGHVRGLDG